MGEQRPFHRLFGLSWVDFFDGTSVEVKTELDLSFKQQYVDVVLIRKGLERIPFPLPDGRSGIDVLAADGRIVKQKVGPFQPGEVTRWQATQGVEH